MLNWTTTDENERIAMAMGCWCGKDLLGQIGNETIISELCDLCDSLCTYQERDCDIAQLQCNEMASYNVCSYQDLLSVQEVVTTTIHSVPCSTTVSPGSRCDENTLASTRIVSAVSLSMLVLIILGCTSTAILFKLKGKIKR